MHLWVSDFGWTPYWPLNLSHLPNPLRHLGFEVGQGFGCPTLDWCTYLSLFGFGWKVGQKCLSHFVSHYVVPLQNRLPHCDLA